MKPILIAFLLSISIMTGSVQAENHVPNVADIYIDILKEVYKDADFQPEKSSDGVYLTINGHKIAVQPKNECPQIAPNAAQEPPLCAVFSLTYPVGAEGRYPEVGFDPGRIRNQELLKQLYGTNAHEVSKNCVVVDFLGEKVLFNEKHGAAEALSRVSARLEQHIKADPAIKAYIFPTEGTFYWRTIKDSNRLSAHSFAIAIDLNVEKGCYWLWRPAHSQVQRTRQNYPQAIVDAFEAEGFIWGGKWHSFDFMHFEYRPEMIEHHGRQ